MTNEQPKEPSRGESWNNLLQDLKKFGEQFIEPPSTPTPHSSELEKAIQDCINPFPLKQSIQIIIEHAKQSREKDEVIENFIKATENHHCMFGEGASFTPCPICKALSLAREYSGKDK